MTKYYLPRIITVKHVKTSSQTMQIAERRKTNSNEYKFYTIKIEIFHLANEKIFGIFINVGQANIEMTFFFIHRITSMI